MTSSFHGHKAASVITHVSRPDFRPGGDSWSSSRRTSPHPSAEKDTPGTQSRKFSFPWGLKKASSECSLVGHKHGWKPVTLSVTVLSLFALISLILGIIIEFLAQWAQRNGGLGTIPSSEDFPTYVSFSYRFLPTIIAVFYSLFWSWVDLDAKRMQPWFELSRPSGATAEHSIFLSYPYDFVAFVPLTAFRRRHWETFCSGFSMVIIFWLITPLQSTIFSADVINVVQDIDVVTTASFLPSDSHTILLDQSVINEAYAITWLDQQYPDFTTSTDAFMPFMPLDQASKSMSSNWTGVTTRYWTDLTCWSAEREVQGPPSRRTYSFNNGQGCNITDISPHPTTNPLFPYRMYYFGYQGTPFGSYALANPGCSPAASHQFLATWARAANTTENPDAIDLEAIFCETSYHKQATKVTVAPEGSAHRPYDMTPIGDIQPLESTEFNITAFEYLVTAGLSAVDELDFDREYPFQRLLEQWPRTMEFGLTWPMSPMVGLAVGHQKPTSLDEFQSKAVLEENFRAVHQLMFSVAFTRVVGKTIGTPSTGGVLTTRLNAVVVNRTFSAVVEAFLGLVAVLCLLLAWLCRRSPSNLTKDVSSLTSLIEICRNSPALLDKLSDKGCLTDEELSNLLSNQRMRLRCGCQSPSEEPVIEFVDEDGAFTGDTVATCYDLSASRGHYSPIRPWALRRDVGLVAVLSMSAALVAIIYLKITEQRNTGLFLPVEDDILELLILSFIPTIFATLFEPFWVLLNRLLCILQPFRDLWQGQRPAKGSIDAKYTSVPPQLVLWRAGKAGHFLLSAMCVIALLSNLLAVGLGGLFENTSVPIVQDATFSQQLAPRMSTESILGLPLLPGNGATFEYAEPFYVVMNNITRGTPHPPWIGQEYFFHPFSRDNETKAEQYTAVTRGFGVKPSCSSMGNFTSFGVGPILDLRTVINDTERIKGCSTGFQPELLALDLRRNRIGGGLSAAETVETPVFGRIIQPCDTTLILGWSRSSETLDLEGRIESSFVVCEPHFTTAEFEVTIDPAGHILNSSQVSESAATLDYEQSNNHTDTMIVILNHLLKRTSPVPWHNNTLSQDWLNYLLKIQPGQEDLLDPSTALPDAEVLAKAVEPIYSLLYSLLLGFNDDIFDRHPEPVFIAGTSRSSQQRVFMPMSAFGISAAVLGLNIVIAIAFYGFSVKHFLPRMPTTIGSLLAFLAPSRAVRELDTHDSAARRQMTFSFGRYIGDDGRAHVGIELDPHVVPVSLSSLKGGNTRPSGFTMRRAFTGKAKSKQGSTWL
ncbi:hypothetical protein F5X68DRAFT_260267 [Plectosphaerella plurivora]|uniref:Uncharacterized protein n=1 Tax=Plectosphaerella plurivora TaxID=936078 RepID=A0A9P8VDH3_9PEZI|nr:hypothetical protein F5X68DRAFT_260267 [Plectosphaerella plurivora]